MYFRENDLKNEGNEVGKIKEISMLERAARTENDIKHDRKSKSTKISENFPGRTKMNRQNRFFSENRKNDDFS